MKTQPGNISPLLRGRESQKPPPKRKPTGEQDLQAAQTPLSTAPDPLKFTGTGHVALPCFKEMKKTSERSSYLVSSSPPEAFTVAVLTDDEMVMAIFLGPGPFGLASRKLFFLRRPTGERLFELPLTALLLRRL